MYLKKSKATKNTLDQTYSKSLLCLKQLEPTTRIYKNSPSPEWFSPQDQPQARQVTFEVSYLIPLPLISTTFFCPTKDEIPVATSKLLNTINQYLKKNWSAQTLLLQLTQIHFFRWTCSPFSLAKVRLKPIENYVLAQKGLKKKLCRGKIRYNEQKY